MERREVKKISDVLPLIGEFGPFQWMLDAILCFSNLAVVYQVMIMYFSTLVPTWTCMENSSACVWNETFSADDQRRCQISRNEWKYTEAVDYSLVTAFNIDCNDTWMLELASSVFFIGWAIGSIVIGYIADNYGRKTVFFPSIAILLTIGFLSSFSPHMYIIIACRFIIGFFFAGTGLQGFILISELVGNRHRPFAGIVMFVSTPIGFCILALKAYLLKNWKTLSIVCTAPYIFVILFHRFIPESVEWLHEQGRVEEVVRTLRRVAYWNNKEFPANITFTPVAGEVITKKSNPIDMFRSRRMALLSTIQGLIWAFAAIGYYVLMLAANDFGGSIYRDFVLSNVGGMLSILLSPCASGRFGRKQSTLIPMFIGCLASYCVVCVPSRLSGVRIVLGVIGNICVGITFSSCFTWSSEIYPIRIRSQGLGFLEVCARIGAAASPWIAIFFHGFGSWIPFVAMGTFLLIGSLVGIYLPETKQVRPSKNCKIISNPSTDVPSRNAMSNIIIGKSNNGYN